MTAPLTEKELENAGFKRPSSARGGEEECLPPGTGYIIGFLVGSAVWSVVAIVLWFLLEAL